MRRLVPTLALLLAAAGTAGAQATPGSAAADHAHVGAMAREHAGHTPAANASAQDPAQEVRAEEVVYGSAGGKELKGYVARPARRGRVPAIIVIHEWWGLNDNIRMMTRRLAGEGYTVLAVDMYGGRVATQPQEAQGYMREVLGNTGVAMANLNAAARFLKEERGAEKIGVIGWCFGGAWSLQAALNMPEQVDAAVMYYGRVVTDRDQLSRLDVPLLGLFGAEDRGIPVADVRQMETTLKELGKDVEIHVYEGAGHAFANPSGQAYKADTAEDAWRRTTAFFAEHLKAAR